MWRTAEWYSLWISRRIIQPNTLPIPKTEERAIAAEGGKGILIPRDLLEKITLLSADSAKFDETPYLGSMDLVFVDAAHGYEYV